MGGFFVKKFVYLHYKNECQKYVVRCRKYKYTDMRKLPKARNELLCTDLAKISLPGLNSGHHSNREMESQWKVINFLATMDFLI